MAYECTITGWERLIHERILEVVASEQELSKNIIERRNTSIPVYLFLSRIESHFCCIEIVNYVS